MCETIKHREILCPVYSFSPGVWPSQENLCKESHEPPLLRRSGQDHVARQAWRVPDQVLNNCNLLWHGTYCVCYIVNFVVHSRGERVGNIGDMHDLLKAPPMANYCTCREIWLRLHTAKKTLSQEFIHDDESICVHSSYWWFVRLHQQCCNPMKDVVVETGEPKPKLLKSISYTAVLFYKL